MESDLVEALSLLAEVRVEAEAWLESVDGEYGSWEEFHRPNEPNPREILYRIDSFIERLRK